MFGRRRGSNKEMKNSEMYAIHSVLLGLLNCGMVGSSTGGERSSACNCVVT